MKRLYILVGLFGSLLLALAAPVRAGGQTYFGDPGNYRGLLTQLAPGDTLQLAAGDYLLGLPIDNLHGTAAEPIIIRGPANGPRARFLARGCCNTVSFGDASFIRIYNLELDGQGLANVDAVKAESTAAFSHDIWLENLYIHDHDANQQTVGISTKAPAWNWTIRRNIIDSAGTGLYLGNSNGDAPFVNGLIEGNLIRDTLGYNMQVKHQNPRPNLPGMPPNGRTIIRHNVFSKANNASTGGDARPNLLVGHWPLSGSGQDDVYEIYGNFFYQNPTPEALFQGEGHVALYNNLFVATSGDAIAIQAHNDVPREVRVFLNTIVVPGTGVRVSSGHPAYEQKVIGNAIFAGTPLNVPAGDAFDNISDSYASAGSYLNNPFASPGSLDLHPLAGQLIGSPLPTTWFTAYGFWNWDFNYNLHDATQRGAYATAGANPGWLPQLIRKPLPVPALPHALYLPTAPGN